MWSIFMNILRHVSERFNYRNKLETYSLKVRRYCKRENICTASGIHTRLNYR